MNDQHLIKARATIRYGSTNTNPLLIVLMGLPGSGKSYLADYLYRNYSFTVLSGENITHAIFDTEKCTGQQYKEAYETLRVLLVELLNQRYNVVVDGTNLKYEFRKQIYDAVGPNINSALLFLTVDDSTALIRTNSRGEQYSNPTNIISSVSSDTFAAFKKQLEQPGENERHYQIPSDEKLFERVDAIIQELQKV